MSEYTKEMLISIFPEYDFSNITQDDIDELNGDVEDAIMHTVEEFLRKCE